MRAPLAIGPPDDEYEREAGRVAETVTAGSQVTVGGRAPGHTHGRAGAAFAELDQGTPLPRGERTFMESRLGHDFSSVRIHTGGPAAAAAESVEARAFAVGNDVVFGAGQYRPGSTAGRRLLAHELTHVAQQRAGKAPRSVQRQPEDGPEAPAPAPPAAPEPAPAAPAPCTPAPTATLVAFNNAGTTAAENCCPVCPVDLGVSPGSRALNGMEMQIRIADPCPGSEYDILRVRQSWIWQRVGGAWTEVEHQGPGENDDHHSDDECLRLRRGRFLYVEDRPGWPGTTLPAPVGRRWGGITGVQTDAAATDVVAQDVFAEWVNYRNRAAGIDWTPISSPRFFYWHSVLWFTQEATGWHLDAGNTEIERGFRRAVVRP